MTMVPSVVPESTTWCTYNTFLCTIFIENRNILRRFLNVELRTRARQPLSLFLIITGAICVRDAHVEGVSTLKSPL